MKKINGLLLTCAAALALSAGSSFAQAPEVPDPSGAPEAREAPAERDAPRPQSIERIGSDYTLPEGETVRELVVIRGEALIAGEVVRDVVSIIGQARVAGTAEIGGDLVVLAGPLTIESGAVVDGDIVVIGGSLDAPPDFRPGGDQISLASFVGPGPFASVLPWFSSGLLLGRPIVPELPWVWAVVLVAALIYLAMNFIFERPVRNCADVLAEKPLTTFLVGLLVLLLVGPLTGLLTISIIGLPIVPCLWLVLLLVGLFGRAGVFRWVGARVMAEESPGDRLEAARSLGIGMAAICLIYMVPVLGFVTWTAVGLFGLGAAATTVFAGLRREHPAAPVSEANLVDRPDLNPAAVAAPGEVEGDAASSWQQGLAEYPAASFASRLGAVALDVMLLAVASVLLDFGVGKAFILFLVYHVVLWGWKTTTVGGIVCQLRVARVDGRRLQFSDALVRGLSCIVSVVPGGLGWLWILWDSKKQAWHDKISGTYVLRVPSSLPLP